MPGFVDIYRMVMGWWSVPPVIEVNSLSRVEAAVFISSQIDNSVFTLDSIEQNMFIAALVDKDSKL